MSVHLRKSKDLIKARGLGLDTRATAKRSLEDQVQFALMWLKGHSTRATLEGMARYSIPSDHAYGVAMKDIKARWVGNDALRELTSPAVTRRASKLEVCVTFRVTSLRPSADPHAAC